MIQHNLYETPACYFAEIDNLIIKFICKCKGHRIAKKIFKNENKVRELTFLDFKTYYTAIVINTMCYLRKDRHIVNKIDLIFRNKSLHLWSFDF